MTIIDSICSSQQNQYSFDLPESSYRPGGSNRFDHNKLSNMKNNPEVLKQSKPQQEEFKISNKKLFV